MESDELYDSLDEASNASNASRKNVISVKITNSSDSNYTFARNYSTSTINDAENTWDIEKFVPLYRGDICKSDVAFNKKKSTSTPVLNNIISKISETSSIPLEVTGVVDKTKPKRRQRFKFSENSTVTTPTLIRAEPVKSYLGIFHSKIGYPGGKAKEEAKDTTRSVFGDTRRSLPNDTTGREEFVNTDGHDSDSSTSFYFSHIEEEQRILKLSHESQSSSSATQSPRRLTTPLKLNSVSPIIVNKKTSKPVNMDKRPPRPVQTPIPIMGGLGPDTSDIQEKLERRRRQLSYGQKASTRNRIKIQESIVLKNLKSEKEKSTLMDKTLSALCIGKD